MGLTSIPAGLLVLVPLPRLLAGVLITINGVKRLATGRPGWQVTLMLLSVPVAAAVLVPLMRHPGAILSRMLAVHRTGWCWQTSRPQSSARHSQPSVGGRFRSPDGMSGSRAPSP